MINDVSDAWQLRNEKAEEPYHGIKGSSRMYRMLLKANILVVLLVFMTTPGFKLFSPQSFESSLVTNQS